MEAKANIGVSPVRHRVLRTESGLELWGRFISHDSKFTFDFKLSELNEAYEPTIEELD